MADFKECLSGWNIDISADQLSMFEEYYALLISWNSKFNLTAVTGREDVYIKHFLDSLALLSFCDINDKLILDVGTGAGFPGIPLAIMNAKSDIVLLDSLSKRIFFLETVVDKLNLSNVKCICGRAEELGHDVHFRQSFDIVTSRAVAGLNILSEYCLPFVKSGGSFISYKGPDPDDELRQALNAISLLGGCPPDLQKYNIPFTDIARSLIFIEKSFDTPERFPRRTGKPLKKPL
ncbi:MAG: 16S rRNA (guanine(527)-N(7))-methyltransferase RsmG [Lachnospiraceae bacterium]|nr:16S rRNA (guanine(527)-N(7))-methyltransferase RsmG [Lachnospiraceae bacterium]